MLPKGMGCLAISALWPTLLRRIPETCMLAGLIFPLRDFGFGCTSLKPLSRILSVGDFVPEALVDSVVEAGLDVFCMRFEP